MGLYADFFLLSNQASILNYIYLVECRDLPEIHWLDAGLARYFQEYEPKDNSYIFVFVLAFQYDFNLIN